MPETFKKGGGALLNIVSRKTQKIIISPIRRSKKG
jgi:hypothetical protein